MSSSVTDPKVTSFWKDKRVIVTGGSGFLGRVIVNKFYTRGVAEVTVPRRHESDLRDLTAIQRLLHGKSYQKDDHAHTSTEPVNIIIHLAANVGGIGANRSRPAEFFYDNLMMGTQLIHESWHAGVGKFVAIGTVCAYPKYAPIPFHEEDLWNGFPEATNAPYGIAKKMMLVQSEAYRQQYGFNSIFLLPVNLYGPGDNFDLETSHVIPALIRKCVDAVMRGEDQIVVWGDGSPTREFLYVDDAAEGILLAAEHYNDSAPVNMGSSFEVSIKELVDIIVRHTGFVGKVVWDTTKPNGQPRRKLDVRRAREAFGFAATTSFEDGLQKTIDWYIENYIDQQPASYLATPRA